MSASNTTTNYSFPLFIGTDKPAWLVDWNSAMTAIDAAIKGVDTDVQRAIVDISGLSSTVAYHTSSISTISGQITVITTNLNTATGNINTINSLIGNGTPTTTDQTIIGAINEINGYVSTVDAHLTNRYVIDAADAAIATVTADGTKTFNTLIGELTDAIIAFAASEPNSAILELSSIKVDQLGDINLDRSSFASNQTTAASLTLKGSIDVLNASTGDILFGAFFHDINATALTVFNVDKTNATLTLQVDDSYVPAAGNKLVAISNIYEKYDI